LILFLQKPFKINLVEMISIIYFSVEMVLLIF
jgi:hypothetical protein